MSILAIVVIVIAHMLGDFVFQRREDARGKSKDLRALSSHVAMYMPFLALMALTAGPIGWGMVWFVLLNAALHWVTDYFTSRESAQYAYTLTMGDGQEGAYLPAHSEKPFWNTIGYDQCLHFLALFLTYHFMLS